MRKLKKEIFLGTAGLAVCVLTIVRCAQPDWVRATQETPSISSDSINRKVPILPRDTVKANHKMGLRTTYSVPRFKDKEGNPVKSRIYSMSNFKQTFPDLQEVHIVSARQWGVNPVENRKEAELRKEELVYVGSNPYYTMDKRMSYSIPYLVPRASDLLQKISRNFLDSLAVKNIPLHTLIVTSVLRTEDDVRKLRRFNGNASEVSCHRFGTTFDICYNRYNTVSPPDGPERRAVRNDSLKWVLSEVLRDLRTEKLCYVKYEVKQGCFHITVR
ncbi:MAG: DUF5715 family protein [Paraprevotella sp.]|nr:DUF5715 family protein [Paraprevotella sp.]